MMLDSQAPAEPEETLDRASLRVLDRYLIDAHPIDGTAVRLYCLDCRDWIHLWPAMYVGALVLRITGHSIRVHPGDQG